MYSNASDREGRTAAEAVEKDIKAMREHNPHLKVTEGDALPTGDKKTALVKYFSGDTFGNYEAAAYVIEKNVVANIILTARNKDEYDALLPAFRKLVSSYRFVSDDPGKLDLAALAKAERKRNEEASLSTGHPSK